MSNRRRLRQPPARYDAATGITDPAAAARAYRCSHCHSKPGRLTRDLATGLPCVEITHQLGCPVATGAIPAGPDIARATSQTPPPAA